MDVLRISCAHAVTYVPHFAGLATGQFAKRDLSLAFYHGRGTVEDTVGAVNRGEVDLLLGSCVYGLRLAQTGIDPVVVAQINQQTHHVVAQRAGDAGGLNWADLRGKVMVVHPGGAPTAWAAFTYALGKAGLSTSDLKLVIGYTAADSIGEFARGVGDVFFAHGEAALEAGFQTTLPVCRQSGNLPWSVYMADRRLAERKQAAMLRFADALDSTQKWMQDVSTDVVVDAVLPYFPSYSRERLAAAVAYYRAIDLWTSSSDVRLDQLQRWSEALRLNGLLAPDKQLTDMLGVLR